MALPKLGELVPEIVRVVIKESLLLQKVDEHKAVEHDAYVPCLHLFIGDTGEESKESLTLLLESIVECLGGTLDIEHLCFDHHVRQCDVLFLFETDGQVSQLLDERLT